MCCDSDISVEVGETRAPVHSTAQGGGTTRTPRTTHHSQGDDVKLGHVAVPHALPVHKRAALARARATIAQPVPPYAPPVPPHRASGSDAHSVCEVVVPQHSPRCAVCEPVPAPRRAVRSGMIACGLRRQQLLCTWGEPAPQRV